MSAVQDPPAEAKALPLFEGYRVSDHFLNFGGNIKLEDQEVIDELTLGKAVTLVVRGRVVSRTHKGKDDEAGNRTGAAASSVVVVESVTTYDE